MNEYRNKITERTAHYPQLPDGWIPLPLKYICSTISGLWKGKKEPFMNVGVIRNANFTKEFKLNYSNIEYIDVEFRSFEKRHLLRGDLIVEKSGGSDNNPVGRAVLYNGDDRVFSFSNFTMVLRLHDKEELIPEYLFYYLLARYQNGDMSQMQTQTTGLHNLILDKYLDMIVLIPPRQEQRRILMYLNNIYRQLDIIAESL